MDLTKEEYQKKREEIINNFTQGFIDKTYDNNAYTMAIIESLIRNENPYNIIEKLVINQDNLIKKLNEVITNSPMPPIILKSEK